MLNNVINNYLSIQQNINKAKLSSPNVEIISVSKTFQMDKIMPLVLNGNIHFGENKVQEADSKWTEVLEKKPQIRLHMIGKLQSNKAKKALQIFHYIHSLDSKKLADILSKCENELNKKLSYFIQVNVGNESQKSGILPNEIDQFYTYCSREKNLNIVGLMAIPPNDGNEDKHFQFLYEANASLGLKELSIGMSADYLIALKHSPTFLRIGSSIFGPRS
jgi:pyridoxal phosphate enzyme (YggS family)|tara:strand:+ start:329 stop:985 length:657 start_codon:yes stop_codon:yes gene_type:complete